MVGCAQPALLAFPSERPVFVREYSTNHYSVLSYFLSRFIIEAVVTALQVFKIVRMPIAINLQDRCRVFVLSVSTLSKLKACTLYL